MKSVKMQLGSKNAKILGKSLPEIALEVIIVVFGILIAFLLNNWWDNVQQRREHKDILTSLEMEFSANKKLILEEKKWIEQAKESALNILIINPDSIREGVKDQIDTFLYNILGIPDFEPNNAVVEDIINSGKIKYLENDELAKAISKWQAELILKNDLEKEAAERTEQTIRNYLFDRLSFLRLDKTFSPLQKELENALDYGHDYEVFSEKKFRNFVDDQFFHFSQYYEKLDDINYLINKVLTLIKEQLKIK